MSNVVESRDPYTAGHEERVSRLAEAIGAELGIDERAARGLRLAARIHDIGKIAVPSEILTKPSSLTATEFDLIKVHPAAAYEILAPIDFGYPVAEIVAQHHERLDGSGYPDGLSGDGIMLEAKILGVADVVEAMASHRPYRPALGLDVALREIRRNSGRLYDRATANACLRVFKRNGFTLGS